MYTLLSIIDVACHDRSAGNDPEALVGPFTTGRITTGHYLTFVEICALGVLILVDFFSRNFNRRF